VDDWERWLDVSREDAHAEFYGAWDQVRFLPGRMPLESALEYADRLPLELNAETREGRPEGYQRFISIAGWLQVGMGDRNILLPVEDLAEALGVQPMTVSRYRKWAEEDGFLKQVKGHVYKGKGRGGKATEFRFKVGRFPILREAAQEGTAESFDETSTPEP
jgi:hypothetical protein